MSDKTLAGCGVAGLGLLAICAVAGSMAGCPYLQGVEELPPGSYFTRVPFIIP
jgi:hypothetical protein